MKLITLNIWGGQVREPLLDFVSANRDTHIFCFQELYRNAPSIISLEDRKVSLNIFTELEALLPNHKGYFRPTVQGSYGIGMFVDKSLNLLGEGEVTIHACPEYSGRGPTHPRNLQWIQYEVDQQITSIINVHGLWNGRGKTDTPQRLQQSLKIREFIDTLQTPKVLCGDFNLRPDTESMKILNEGMVNLIDRHQIQSTRTKYYTKPEQFADYILTSPEIRVNDFKVMPDAVSDHSPLMLDFQSTLKS